MTLTQSQNLEM